jgi:predicted Zn-dependent peptidase
MPATRSVAFGIWVKVGSRNETMLNNGITHLIEHMIFKGTERYSAREIAEIFDGLGGNINAFTSKENTCYFFIPFHFRIGTAKIHEVECRWGYEQLYC